MSAEELPSNKEELVRRIDREWSELERVVNGLSEEELTRPGPEGWSPKDHLAHLAAWQRVLLLQVLQGGTFADAAGMDRETAEATAHMTAETGLNDWFQQRDREAPLGLVLENYRAAHDQLVVAIEGLSDEQLFRPAEGNAKPPVEAIKDDTYDHYRDHRRVIKEMVGQVNNQ